MKHIPGFVPVQFNKMGNIFAILGIVILAMGIWKYFFDLEWMNNYIDLFVGVFLIIIGLYLRKYVPKEDITEKMNNNSNEKK